MNFFCFHRDRVGAAALRQDLREDHWSYMDRFAEQLIARGPTFVDDDVVTGSVHIIRVADPVEARAFAFDEPYYQAGVFRDVLLRRWENQLGRTMWQFPNPREEARRFLVLGLDGHEARPTSVDDKLIACGPLLSDDGSRRLGAMALVQAEDAAEARGMLSAGGAVEVHRWEFGGRPADWPEFS